MVLSINPFDSNNPMGWRDAAIVSVVLAFVTWILTFLYDASLGMILEAPLEFLFDAVKTYLIAWAGSFIGLAGLEQYVKSKEE